MHTGLRQTIVPLYVLISILFLISYGCSKPEGDPRLHQIIRIVEEDPELAKSILDSIDVTGLNKSDDALYCLMTVKANNRQYILHESDSLILRSLAYYKNNETYLYPEALYYAGEVYTDMGDTPKALKFYQEALSKVHPDSLILKSRILNSMVWLFNSMRIYDQSIPYGKEVVKIDQLTKRYDYLSDSHQTLGYIHLQRENFDSAEYEFSKSAELARKYIPEYEPTARIYVALVKYKKNQIDSALTLLRPEMDRVRPVDRNITLNIACRIYHAAGIPDTALLYARELVNNKKNLGKLNGYKLLLSSDMVKYSSADSIVKYTTSYGELIEEQMNRYCNELTLVQTSLYNYNLHDKAREESDKKATLWLMLLIISVILSLGIIIYALYRKNRYNRELLHLREAIDVIQNINAKDASGTAIANTKEEPEQNVSDRESLKNKLRAEVLAACENRHGTVDISPTITSSDAYRQIMEHLDEEKSIPHTSPLWTDIDKVVSESYPSFKSNLNILSVGHLNDKDYHLALLIKCGLKPAQTSSLFGKSKNAISYHRNKLCTIILEDEKDLNLLDKIINIL